MSGSIKGKKSYYSRKHKMEQARKRIRQWKEHRLLRIIVGENKE